MICGLKLSHDGAIAVVADGQLIACVEVEKLSNNRRHARLHKLKPVLDELSRLDVDIRALRSLAIDGWRRIGESDPRLEISDIAPGETHHVTVAGYSDMEADERGGPFAVREGSLPVMARDVPYRSYLHTTGHVFGSYCTSPFAAAREPSLILVWDGGMPACLYGFDPETRALKAHGVVLHISGSLYPVFASQFDPFRIDDRSLVLEARTEEEVFERYLPISGKAMALAGYGQPDEELMGIFEHITDVFPPTNLRRAVVWSRRAANSVERLGASVPTILASFQEYLYRSLEIGLRSALRSLPGQHALSLSGGCALNIKWNSRLRESGLFAEVWVPPFPNDAGSAIGTACAEMVQQTGQSALEWNVFSGPLVRGEPAVTGWARRECSIEEIARILHEDGEPIAVLNGRAELGPRALGHRSILAPATSGGMRDVLNRAKKRESYRPVAPICLESEAPTVFSPGTRDPYMLFDHTVRPEWVRRIPAVVHVDGTARLQTVGRENQLMHRLLNAYAALSATPVLCNTSANLPGSGFFPDAASAMQWGGVSRVWCDGNLYQMS